MRLYQSKRDLVQAKKFQINSWDENHVINLTKSTRLKRHSSFPERSTSKLKMRYGFSTVEHIIFNLGKD